MGGALIILAVTVAVGIILWAWEKARGDRPLHHHSVNKGSGVKDEESEVRNQEEGGVNKQPVDESNDSVGNNEGEVRHEPAICCGLHAICEKTGKVNDPPEYYDDEELDRFAGRLPDDYTDEEIEEFRDVLLTLRTSDAPGWTVSLERRRISLPSELQPELELMLSET